MQVNLSSRPILTRKPGVLNSFNKSIVWANKSCNEIIANDGLGISDEGMLDLYISNLFDLTLEDGPNRAIAAAALLHLALDGALMMPLVGCSLRLFAAAIPELPVLFLSVDEHVKIQSPYWFKQDTHFQLLLATDCRDARHFDIYEFEKLHELHISDSSFLYKSKLLLPPYMLLRGIELTAGSALGRDLRHGYILWRASERCKTISFSEFMADPKHIKGMRIHGHGRERIELEKEQNIRTQKALVRRAEQKVKRADSPYLSNLRNIANENEQAAPENYFGALFYGSSVKGFRPASWLEEPVNYPGRESLKLDEIGRNWFIAFGAYLVHRQKDYETDNQVRAALHVLADYILLYLPWWIEKNLGTKLEFPDTPRKFLRYYFVNRTRFHSDKEKSLGELPKTLYELLPMRRLTPDSRNSTRRIIEMFFSFVMTYFEDSEDFVNRGMKNPIQLEFDNEVAGRPKTKTNKVPFAEDIFPFLIHYGQSVEAFGEFLQQQAYEKDIFKEGCKGPLEGYQTADWGYTPVFWYRNKLYRISWVPNIYVVAKRKMQSNPSGLAGIYVNGFKVNTGLNRNITFNFPHLTVVRLLLVMVETGLRAQSVQWLDRRSFDSRAAPIGDMFELYGNMLLQTFHVLFLNTDKSHNEWQNFMTWRARRSMCAERCFQDSLVDMNAMTEVAYEDRENSRFLPIQPLFRSERGAKPVSDGTYSTRWVTLLYGFQVFYNQKSGVDLSGKADALELVKLREGAKQSGTISAMYFAIHTPHACRSTYATHKDGDLELSEIASQLGHSNTVITNRYQVPSAKRLIKKLKEIDDRTMGLATYAPMGLEDAYLHPEHEGSSVRIAFDKNRDNAISNYGFVSGISLWSLSDLDEDTPALELLRKSPSSVIKWHSTHICPVGNQCPREVVANAGEGNRCGICPLATKCVDNLPGIEAKQNELLERIRTAAARISLLTGRDGVQAELDALHRSMQADTRELLGWKLSAEILRTKLREHEGMDVGYHADQPELVRKQLQLVTRSQPDSEFFLQRIAESNTYPSLESAEVRAKAIRYTRLMLATQGRLDEAAYLDVQPHTELAVFAALVKPFVDAKKLSISDLAAAIDGLPRAVMLATPNSTPMLPEG